MTAKHPKIIERLAPVIAQADHAFMDASGVGDPVYSTLRCPKLTGIRITGGKQARRGDIWTASKAMLINPSSSL